MAIGDKAAVGRQLWAVFATGPLGDLTDGQLLERFATGRPEARDLAFAALVERHGPMVLRTCRGILGGRHDAEDAFQATFLVLVRRSRGLWVRDSIGPWLHQVACRTAQGARVAAARRARLDRLAPARLGDRPEDDLPRLVHEELARLSDRDRAVVVLCDLEGETHERAARALDCPIGTVKSRLARARDRLRLRLIRRGLSPETAGAPATMAVLAALPPAVPPSLIRLATAAALVTASAGRLAGPSVASSLAQGVLHTMFLSRLIHSASALLMASVAVLAASVGLAESEAAQDPPASPVQAPATDTQPGRPEMPTAVARPFTKQEIVSETATLVPPPGIDVTVPVAMARSPKLLWSIPQGTTVKKGDLLFRLDLTPVREGLSLAETKVKESEATVKDQEAAEVAAKKSLETYKSQREARRDEARNAEVDGARAVVERAEGRVKRYREANDRVSKLAIDPADPAMVSQTLARLELLDRLEEAEDALDREKRRFAKARATLDETAPKDDPELARLEQRLRTASAAFSESRTSLEFPRSQIKAMQELMEYGEIRSPADGVVARSSAYEIRQTVMNRPTRISRNNSSPRTSLIARIVKAEDADRNVRVAPIGTTRYEFLKPGQSVLMKIPPPMAKSGQATTRTLAATFVESTRMDPFGNVTPDTGGPGFMRVPLFRLEKPEIDLPTDGNVSLEYMVDIPTGSVLVPAQAVDGDRVAVRGADGTFRWRKVVTSAGQGNNLVCKLIGEGEVVALDPRAAMGEPPRPKPASPSQ